jgi:hypothetical protein
MDTRLVKDIDGDLQLSPSQKIIYLEGKSDPPIFFALLGIREPLDRIHQGVFVRGLSGKSDVQRHVETARTQGHGYQGVFGVVDGDGALQDETSAAFDAPFAGPVFTWKSYSIEGLLLKAGWPPDWGDLNWRDELAQYGPYVAINQLHAMLQKDLADLGLANYSHPKQHQTLRTAEDVEAILARAINSVLSEDMPRLFSEQLDLFQDQLARGLDETLAVLNGKWLTEHMAVAKTGKREKDCLSEWLSHVQGSGGLEEVRDLWKRITGREA